MWLALLIEVAIVNANTYHLIWIASKSKIVSEFKVSMKLLETTYMDAYEIKARHDFNALPNRTT